MKKKEEKYTEIGFALQLAIWLTAIIVLAIKIHWGFALLTLLLRNRK